MDYIRLRSGLSIARGIRDQLTLRSAAQRPFMKDNLFPLFSRFHDGIKSDSWQSL